MLATLNGKYLSTISGKSKNGSEWVASKLLIGDQVIPVFGVDFGSRCKVMEDVTVTCNVFARDNQLSCLVPKVRGE